MSNYRETGSKAYLYGICAVAVIGGLLFGYDTAVISGAEQALQKFFASGLGDFYTTSLHGFVVSSALIGCIIGGLISGFMATRLGRRNALILASVFFFLSALGSYMPEFLFRPNFEFYQPGEATKGLMWAFILYRILGGVGVGMASAICPMYIAEVAPANKRGKLVSWNQFAIIFGQLVVYFVNFLIIQSHKNDPAVVEWTNQVGWRLMFGSECVPAGLFTLLIMLVPETPRYLVMSGQEDKALKVLSRINGSSAASQIIADIKATVVEKKEKLMAYGFIVIFIGCMLSVFQQFVGINAVLYFAPRIFESMGMGNAMTQTVVMGIVNISFTLVAIFTVEKLGRKPLLITGSLGMALGALGVALADAVPGVPGIVGVLSIMIYSASFMFSWGPICWVLISEIFPNTIRGAAVAIAVAFQWISNFIVSSTFVPMYTWSPAFTYGLYCFMCLLAALFVWRMVPETKGKTLEDMSALWRSRQK